MVTLQPCPHLVLHTNSGNRYLPLAVGSCWTVGRSPDCDFVLSDPWISRSHAMLQRMEGGGFFLIDLGSRNGSFVNGRRVSIPMTLNSQDSLTFGQTELDFYCPESSAPSSDVYSMAAASVTVTLHVRRLISILVVDIRDFTGLTRQTDERVLSETIGTWFRRAGTILRQYGSWVDKYIGDAVMAVWIHGEQEVGPEEVLQIFQALNELQQMTRELYHQYPLPFPLRIGTGVNTGYAMVGNTGSNDRPDYTALGDTVNAAFRLESATKEIGCDTAIGQTTYQYLCALNPKAHEIFEEYFVQLKGYDGKTLTYASTYDAVERFIAAQTG